MTSIKTNDGFFPTVKDFEDFWKDREKKAFKRGKKEAIKVVHTFKGGDYTDEEIWEEMKDVLIQKIDEK